MTRNPNDVPANRIKVFAHTETYGPEHGFRSGTKLHPIPTDFFFTDAGLGDFICYSVAILWAAKHCPWVCGNLRVPRFLIPFMERIMRRHRHWKILDGEIPYQSSNETPIIGPNLTDEHGNNLTPQLINATGAHLVDLGFMYYCNMQKAPPETYYPKLELLPHELLPEVAALKGQYVVFTPGGITSSRTVRGRHLNPLIEYVLSRGLTPVFLGKTDFSNSIITQFDESVNYGAGLNLIDKTNLFQAAAIMENAICVTGLDNGLLHLACCTEATVLFGYNIAGPEFREPRRKHGKLINITVPKEKLPCIHCQDNFKLLSSHSFHECFYGDTLCIDLLFENNAEKWKRAIDSVSPPA